PIDFNFYPPRRPSAVLTGAGTGGALSAQRKRGRGALAGAGCRPPVLRRRASRPHLKRDPLGSTTRLMRTSILALAVVAACTSEPGRDAAPQHAGPVARAPAASAVPAPTALGSHWPLLDTIGGRLAAFDTQVTNTQHELQTRSATSGGDSLFLKFRNSYMAVAESLTERL